MKNSKNGYIYYDYHKKTEKEEIADAAWTSVFHWVYAIVFILIAFIIVFSVFLKIINVEGDSMKPTLHDGDKILVSVLQYTPEKGDLVLIDINDGASIMMVKRIVATENQTVDIDYKNRTLTVDGVVMQEAYITEMSFAPDNEISYPYTVPQGHVFVLGDNRIDSIDSRNRNIQAVSVESIIGKVIARGYPLSDIAVFE